VEALEDRTLLSNYTAASAADLLSDIKAANQAGGSNTISLVAGKSFDFTTVDNTTDGATGLPVIAANDNLTIIGNSDVIERSTGAGTPAFRLFDVAGGASLTLANLKLQGGLAFGSGLSADGGAILNQGTLNMSGVTVQQNVAQGKVGFGEGAAGGGIYSNGTLTLQNSTIQNNQALGGDGINNYAGGGNGGGAFGGGVAIAGGTANLNNVTLVSNTAQGGNGGKGASGNSPKSRYGGGPDGIGGNGLGGGVYVGGGSVILVGASVNHNTANGGNGFRSGVGEGGGIYIDAAAAVALDAFTLTNARHNSASTSDPNIYGSFTVYP
jgi:hypothetical protein